MKKPPANVGDESSIPGSGRSPGEGNLEKISENPLQHSCLENPTEEPRGHWG